MTIRRALIAATLLAALIVSTGCDGMDPVMGRDANYTPPSTTTLVPPERR